LDALAFPRPRPRAGTRTSITVRHSGVAAHYGTNDKVKNMSKIVNDPPHALIQSMGANHSKFSTHAVRAFFQGLQEMGQVLDLPVEEAEQSGRAWAKNASDEERRFVGLMARNRELALAWWGDVVLKEWDGSWDHARVMLSFHMGAMEACEEKKP